MHGLSPTALLDIITLWDVGMPVRPMEELLEHGEEALPAVLSRVDDWPPEDRDAVALLWLLVLLGLLGGDEAARMLVRALVDEDLSETHRGVAAEALGRIGRPAVPFLLRALEEAPGARLWIYAALGFTRDPEVRPRLLEALAADPEHAGLIASVLAEYGRAEDVPALAQALERCPPWQRADVEDSILRIHRGEGPTDVEDWRLRFRIDPHWGAPIPSMPQVLSVLAEVRAERGDAPPLRSLEEILAEEPEKEEEPRCPDCGELLRIFTGVLTCPDGSVGMAVAQHALLRAFGEEWDTDDLFDLLDEADHEQGMLEERAGAGSRRGRKRREERMEDLRFVRLTAAWLIEQGIEEVDPARAFLLARAKELAEEFGDPYGVFDPPRRQKPAPAVSTESTVGRNQPCPCGSGRKYKKCCGRTDRRATGAPALLTPEGDSLLIARAHFEVRNAGEVRARLDAHPSLTAEGDRSWAWLGDEDEGFRRAFGSVRLEGERLTLEAMSRERLAAGRRLLEAALEGLVSHRADTFEDALRAAAERPARRPRADPLADIPPEERGGLFKRLLDRQYRDWPDEPIPALGGLTPREAVRTARGRRDVADLLRSYEEAPGPVAADPSFRYDFGWMWEELGLEEMR